jgi:hypothetical protein
MILHQVRHGRQDNHATNHVRCAETSRSKQSRRHIEATRLNIARPYTSQPFRRGWWFSNSLGFNCGTFDTACADITTDECQHSAQLVCHLEITSSRAGMGLSSGMRFAFVLVNNGGECITMNSCCPCWTAFTRLFMWVWSKPIGTATSAYCEALHLGSDCLCRCSCKCASWECCARFAAPIIASAVASRLCALMERRHACSRTHTISWRAAQRKGAFNCRCHGFGGQESQKSH